MIVVRRIEPHEWSTYRDLRLRSLLDAPDAFGSAYALEVARPDHAWIARVADGAASGKDLALFAEADGEPCGLAWCKVAAEDARVANLFQMWVAPEQRGRGAGRRLLAAAIAWARSGGVEVLRLGVTVADSPASRLYAVHGFVQVGDLEPLREGSELKARTLELALRAA